MKSSPSIEDIQEDFDIYGITLGDNTEVHEKCLELCQKYKLTGEQIAVCWLGFAAVHDYEDLTREGLERFELEELKSKRTRQKQDTTASTVKSENSLHSVISAADDDLLAAYGASPVIPKNNDFDKGGSPFRSKGKMGMVVSQSIPSSPLAPSLSQSPSASQSQRYTSRTNAGTVVAATLRSENLGPETWIVASRIEPKVQELACGGDSSLAAPYNYMFEKLRDCADILDDTIYNMGDQMKEALDIDEIAHLRVASNESVWCIGRICCDSVGRLNAVSVVLEGDRETCNGDTVSLDLSRLSNYALFPGQVVAVKGINTTGSKLVAEDIVIGKCLQSSKHPITIADEGLQIRIACGPFTTSENLLYEPLTDLLTEVVNNPPHILILLGPLVDSSHPLLDELMLTDPYDSILMRGLEKIDAACQNLDIQVFIVTSFRDICCPLIFPTPPSFLSTSVPTGSKIKLLPDPSLLSIDGLTIALTTSDVMMHISKEEISFPPQSGDKFKRLARHLLLQQSFYPLYPAPEGFCLSLEQADLHARLPFTPHIMIIPSELKGFIKETEDCLIINPERLAKGRIGGCYVRLVARPPTENNIPLIDAQIVRI